MNSKILKEYKEKYDKMKKDSEETKEKTILAEEKSVNEIFEKYTDRPDDSIEKSLFEYGILRNPKTEKTIIGIEKSGDKFIEFIFDYISEEEIIDEINRMDNSFFDKLQGVVGSKEELLQAIIQNEGNIAVIILILMGHRDNKIFDMIENSRGNSIDLTMLKDMVENEVEGEKQEMYEYKYNEDGIIVEVKKAKKELDIFPEAKKFNINVLDEMNGYKVIYKDEKNNCRLFGKFESERLAEKKIQQVFENIKSRKHDGGAGLYIYSPYDYKGKLVKQITESNYISLKEEYNDEEESNENKYNMDEVREYIAENIEKLYEQGKKDGIYTDLWIDYFHEDLEHFMFGFEENVDERLRKSLNNEGRILDSNRLDFYEVSSSYFFENESLFNYIREKNLSVDEWIDFYNGFIYSMSDIIKVLEEVDSDELKLNYSDTVDESGERELKEEDLNEGCWLVAEAREGSDTLKELYELLGKDINDIYPLLETSEDFEKAINYLKQWEYGDEEKEYEPYNDVIKYFSNYDEIDGYIIGETPKGDVLLYAKGEWTVDEKKNLKEEDMNEGCYFVAEAKDGSDLMNELYNLLGKEDYENLFSSKEDYEKALNYLKQREYGDEEKNYEPYYDVLKYFKGNYEEIDGYIIGETPYGDVLVYAKGEWTID